MCGKMCFSYILLSSFAEKKKARGRFFILCLSSFGKLWGRATWEKSQISLVRKILLSMSKYIKELDLLFVHYSFWRSGWCMKFLWDTPNTEAQLGVPPPLHWRLLASSSANRDSPPSASPWWQPSSMHGVEPFVPAVTHCRHGNHPCLLLRHG